MRDILTSGIYISKDPLDKTGSIELEFNRLVETSDSMKALEDVSRSVIDVDDFDPSELRGDKIRA
jgi:hypothetical protein